MTLRGSPADASKHYFFAAFSRSIPCDNHPPPALRRVAPSQDFHPFAGFEVLVVDEEVLRSADG